MRDIRDYVEHMKDCAAWDGTRDGKCTCGLDEVLAVLSAPPAEPQKDAWRKRAEEAERAMVTLIVQWVDHAPSCWAHKVVPRRFDLEGCTCGLSAFTREWASLFAAVHQVRFGKAAASPAPNISTCKYCSKWGPCRDHMEAKG